MTGQAPAYNPTTDFSSLIDFDKAKLDIEFDAIALTINLMRDQLELAFRDDGQLREGVAADLLAELQSLVDTAEGYRDSTEADAATVAALKSQTEDLRDQVNVAVSTAQNEASNAATSATTAERYANEPEDSEIAPGLFSAFHWLKKAQALANQALTYQGSHDASTGSYPASPQQGHLYLIGTAGTISGQPMNVGDIIAYNGASWDYFPNSQSVTSVAGRTGAVTLTAADVGLANLVNALQLRADQNLGDVANAATALANIGGIDETALNAAIADAVGELTKGDVGLGDVVNALQLVATNNLSDLVNAATARGNLGLGTAATRNTGTAAGQLVLFENLKAAIGLADPGVEGLLYEATGAQVNATGTGATNTAVTPRSLVDGGVRTGRHYYNSILIDIVPSSSGVIGPGQDANIPSGGLEPSVWGGYLVCTSLDKGYPAGYRVPLTVIEAAGGYYGGHVFCLSNGWRYVFCAGLPLVPRYDAPVGQIAIIDAAKWKLQFRAIF